MSQENVETVERAISHLAKGEWNRDLFGEDVEVRDHDIPDAGVYRGREGFDAWIAQWGAAWGGFSIEAEEYLDAGSGQVVFVFRLTAQGRGSGVKLTRQDAIVSTVRGGKVVRLDYYNNRDQALVAVGMAE